MLERDIENAMVVEVTKLLLELGAGFAFLGNQYHLNVGGEDFYLDLQFYNLKLRMPCRTSTNPLGSANTG